MPLAASAEQPCVGISVRRRDKPLGRDQQCTSTGTRLSSVEQMSVARISARQRAQPQVRTAPRSMLRRVVVLWFDGEMWDDRGSLSRELVTTCCDIGPPR